jgi:hypothetical protein
MYDRFEKILKEKIGTLPYHQTDSNLWEMISDQLDFEDRLKTKLPGLPEYAVSDDMWLNIEPDLENGIPDKTRKIQYWVAAASLTLIIGIGSYFYVNNKTNVAISQETIENWQVNEVLANDSLDKNLMDYMTSICENKTYVAHETEFCEKNKQLQEIENELSIIEKAIEKYGSSPSLVTTHIKLENTKASLIKELVKKLSS